jgi:hypothetical protein
MTNKATIVFANGSKEMAHNLDDLRERWILRKKEEEEYSRVQFDPSEAKDYRNPRDLAESRQWVSELKEEERRIEIDLAAIKNRDREDRLLSGVYFAYRASFVAEKAYKVAARLYLQAWAKTRREEERLGGQTLESAVRKLLQWNHAMVSSGKLILSEDEQAIIDAAQAALYLEWNSDR